MNEIEHNHNYYLLALWYKLHKYSRLLSIQFKDNSLTIAISGLNLKFASLSYFHVKRLFPIIDWNWYVNCQLWICQLRL